jgi:hypothetical protein
LRYEFIAQALPAVSCERLMHIDADMLVVEPVFDLESQNWTGGLAFVRHPGFRRPQGQAALQYYLRHPNALRLDAKLRRKIGALGAWETDPMSAAFVARPARRNYVYGAIWMGLNERFAEMCEELALCVQRDSAADLMAIWHDESHLNRYASEHPHTLLDSDLAFVYGWKNLIDLRPRIVAVEKGARQTR